MLLGLSLVEKFVCYCVKCYLCAYPSVRALRLLLLCDSFTLPYRLSLSFCEIRKSCLPNPIEVPMTAEFYEINKDQPETRREEGVAREIMHTQRVREMCV